GSEKVTFFGYTIGDWAEFISIIGVGVSAGSWLFKKIALDPLRSDIQVGKNVNGPDKNCPVLPNAYGCHLNSR
ncbi:hypothetical protein OIU45_15460, partial [Lacticaseibacillus paracasei]